MSMKGQITTADPLPWSEAIRLIRELGKSGDYKYQLLVTAGIFFGLRIWDIQHLRWSDVLGKEEAIIVEHKTKKIRRITINKEVQDILANTYLDMAPRSKDDYIIKGDNKGPLTIQAINKKLKRLKGKHGLNIDRISTHSLRKTFGTKVWEDSPKDYETLLLLMDIFNHTSPVTTKRYLGITQDKIKSVYTSLTFN